MVATISTRACAARAQRLGFLQVPFVVATSDRKDRVAIAPGAGIPCHTRASSSGFGPAMVSTEGKGQDPTRSAPTRTMGSFPRLTARGAPGHLDRSGRHRTEGGRRIVTPDSTEGSSSEAGFVRDALGERQKPRALLALATEGTDPRLTGRAPHHGCRLFG